ncbi:MAG: metal-dependent hydrolase [Flavobacterium piscis]|nr:metal-dependent hydrolase [Flavobacterium piscis]
MKITYYGHASLGIEVGAKHIIVDPFITGNPLANAIDINILKADYILLTHAHYDHVLDVEAIAKNTDAVIVSNPEITTYYEKKGFKSHFMNHGGSWKFDFGTLRYVSAAHSSSFPDGTYGGNPGGFVIETKSKNIYIAGDTALTYDMKLIPLRAKLDLAILPIGNNFTMDVQDAIVASDFVECNKIMGYHYDTNGHIEINHEESIGKFLDKGKELLLLEVGELLEL